VGVASRPSSAMPLEERSVRPGDRPLLYKHNGLGDLPGYLVCPSDRRSECGFGANVQVGLRLHL